jgi:hypothetical protein
LLCFLLGYLYSLSLVRKRFRNSISDLDLRKIIEAIIESGKIGAKREKDFPPLMYGWHDKVCISFFIFLSFLLIVFYSFCLPVFLSLSIIVFLIIFDCLSHSICLSISIPISIFIYFEILLINLSPWPNEIEFIFSALHRRSPRSNRHHVLSSSKQVS